MVGLVVVAIAVVAVGGLAAEFIDGPVSARFNLDYEWGVPAFVSSLLLFATSACLFQLSGRLSRPHAPRLFALLLAVAAIDELSSVHESLEASLGIDWQKLYLPGALVTAILGAMLLVELPTRRARVLFALGGAAWLASQTLEFLQWDALDRPVSAYVPMMISEEVLEMAGTALILFATLTIRAPAGAEQGMAAPST